MIKADGYRRPGTERRGEPACGQLPSMEEFGQMVAQHRSRLEAIARNVLQDTAAAEDAVSEAALRVWLRMQTKRPDHPIAYLTQAVRNEALTQLRRRQRERLALHAVGASDVTEATTEGHIDDRDEVQRLLADLPPMQRWTLQLRYEVDHTEAEIATLLGIARGTVKGYTHRGLRRLRANAGTAAGQPFSAGNLATG